MLYQLRKELHLSGWELKWGESWVNIAMMLADAPQYITGNDPGGATEATDEDLKNLADIL